MAMTRLPRGRPARFYAVVALCTGLATVCLKTAAYLITGSVGLLSDAAESIINVVAAAVAVWALTVAMRPPDAGHPYGHSKAEYFSSAVESVLILCAACAIGVAAWGRLQHLQPLENVGLGLVVSLVATVLNGAVALLLWRAGQRLRSITLRADAQHLLTDVWTSVGVLVAVVLVAATGWLILDPLIALLVAANIVWTALRLLRETAHGLLDSALPSSDQAVIARILADRQVEGIAFHAVRTRIAGRLRFVSLHVLVPPTWDVCRGHALCEEVAAEIEAALPQTAVFTHLEPVDDPASWNDEDLDGGSVACGGAPLGSR
jgi:cation diffusion facilitator family transporter